MDKKLQEILLLLADTILPLNTWLEKPDRADIVTPWRDKKLTTPTADGFSLINFIGKLIRENLATSRQDAKSTTLTAESLSLINFIEQLIAESTVDDDLAKRWDEVEKNPLAVFLTLPKRDSEWRKSRGLEEMADFGIVKSENVEITLDNPEKASSRREFYDHAFQLLLGVLPDSLPPDFQPFIVELLKDKNPAWPDSSIVKSSHFIKQFTKDLFYALIGMKVQPPQLESLAVLIEAGEHRRVGNSYSIENVRAAVAVFDAKLKEFGI
jgi:hypothetical protein